MTSERQLQLSTNQIVILIIAAMVSVCGFMGFAMNTLMNSKIQAIDNVQNPTTAQATAPPVYVTTASTPSCNQPAADVQHSSESAHAVPTSAPYYRASAPVAHPVMNHIVTTSTSSIVDNSVNDNSVVTTNNTTDSNNTIITTTTNTTDSNNNSNNNSNNSNDTTTVNNPIVTTAIDQVNGSAIIDTGIIKETVVPVI